MATKASRILKRSFDAPDEVRTFPHGRMDLVTVGGAAIGRMTFEPGWRWTRDMPAVAGTPTCRTHHLGMVARGVLRIHMDDGTEVEAGPGDVAEVLPGHDAWVVGDEPVEWVEFAGARHYAEHDHDHEGVGARGAAKPGAVSILPEGLVAGAPPAAESPQAVLQRFLAVVNGGHLEDLGEVLHEDVVDHDPMPGTAPGIAGFREAIRQMDLAFPDGKVVLEDSFEAGDRVAYVMVFEGPHRGAFLGMAPTGRRVRLRATGIFRVADGKVVESWGGPDVAGLMAQLGALPGGTR